MLLSKQTKFARDRLISASEFDKIKTIEQQRHDIDSEILRLIAELFVQFGHDGKFGICLVHRHGSLREDGYAMVHSRLASGVDRCGMQKVTDAPFYPSSYVLDETHGARPFEYSSLPQVEPNGDFVIALTELLSINGLCSTLGLCRALPAEPPWIEHVSTDSPTTFAIQLPDEGASFGQSGVVTEWGFLREGANIRVKALRECVKPEGGGHRKE